MLSHLLQHCSKKLLQITLKEIETLKIEGKTFEVKQIEL